jgi:hypothetical protein
MERGDELREMSTEGKDSGIDRNGNEAENQQETKRWSI